MAFNWSFRGDFIPEKSAVPIQKQIPHGKAIRNDKLLTQWQTPLNAPQCKLTSCLLLAV